ncbi:MAG: DNA/RNA non-specific endonuclease [Victivallaceae bacterium]|nr:DNA/RNA non-specific endonuclease [Victivallaceae bacterium]
MAKKKTKSGGGWFRSVLRVLLVMLIAAAVLSGWLAYLHSTGHLDVWMDSARRGVSAAVGAVGRFVDGIFPREPESPRRRSTQPGLRSKSKKATSRPRKKTRRVQHPRTITQPGLRTSDIVDQDASIKPVEKGDNTRYGVPGESDCRIDRDGYSLGFSDYHKQPIWVSYRLTRPMVETKAAKRKDDFREDPAIPNGSATLGDYRASGYDRGHIAPAADMAYSAKTMSESFFMSNMSPQVPAFNRGGWKYLEEQVRDFARREGDIYVVTGPVLPETKTISIGPSMVTVPEKYYKVIYDVTPPQKMIGFIMPNSKCDDSVSDYAVTVDAVEKLTGLDFFSEVPAETQEQLEGQCDPTQWRWVR